MIKQFYEKALPSQGVYCVAKITATKRTVQEFAETLDDLEIIATKFGMEENNVYVALSSFDGYSRKAEDSQYLRSFFIDLDVGDTKAEIGRGYATKADAHIALQVFLARADSQTQSLSIQAQVFMLIGYLIVTSRQQNGNRTLRSLKRSALRMNYTLIRLLRQTWRVSCAALRHTTTRLRRLVSAK
jgi:hypothetical protein